LGISQEQGTSFDQVLETAIRLKAPAIRVWAGDRGTDRADEAWWDRVMQDASRIAALAEKESITIDYEYHAKTLTDSLESTLRLL
jgi:3-dehydroshikimate dehydratase